MEEKGGEEIISAPVFLNRFIRAPVCVKCKVRMVCILGLSRSRVHTLILFLSLFFPLSFPPSLPPSLSPSSQLDPNALLKWIEQSSPSPSQTCFLLSYRRVASTFL
jgi:hypothetical protein